MSVTAVEQCEGQRPTAGQTTKTVLSPGFGLGVVGFATLMVITTALFAHSFVEAVQHSALPAVLMALALVGLAVGLRIEWLSLLRQPTIAIPLTVQSGLDAAAVILATVMTYYISVPLGQGAVVASALVGVLAALLVPRWAMPIYCGSFVGMISHLLIQSWWCVALSGAISAIIYVLAEPTLNGFGGKLGTIAFAGCLLSALIRGERALADSVPDATTGLWVVGYSVAAAAVTYSISVRLGHGPVMASGIVGLVGGLSLPVAHPTIGGLLTIAVFCGSFAGMSTAARFANEWYMVLAGALCGLVIIYSSPHMGGVGGKLGAIAFGSTIALSGLREGIRLLREHHVRALVAGRQMTPG